jgi:pyruvate ferredoxin oxidoreductase gamma subunit
MFQVRFHGRGGQGVVTAAELLSIAAFREGKFAQAFPTFGSERMGAPVTSFCRIDDRAIRLREPILEPDAIVVQDATLLQAIDVFQGGKREGFILVNSVHGPVDLGIEELVKRSPPHHVACIAATDLARRHVGRPLPNAALLGALAALTKIVHIDSVLAAIRERFDAPIGDRNAAAACAAFDAIAGTA